MQSNYFRVTKACKNFRGDLNKQEENGDGLKDGGAHAEEQQTRETWRKRGTASDNRQNPGGGTASEVGEVNAESR